MSAHLVLPADEPRLADEARRARQDPYNSRDLLMSAASGGPEHSGEVIVAGFVFDESFESTLLVQHRRLGWLPPGGRLEPGEAPAQGALREVVEETGLRVEFLFPEPAAVLGSDDATERKYGLAYAFAADRSAEPHAEPLQPVAWFALEDVVFQRFARDRDVLVDLATRLRGGP